MVYPTAITTKRPPAPSTQWRGSNAWASSGPVTMGMFCSGSSTSRRYAHRIAMPRICPRLRAADEIRIGIRYKYPTVILGTAQSMQAINAIWHKASALRVPLCDSA